METKAYWNARAALGEKAGTQDLILYRLEVEEIAKHVKDGMRVLDVGCGNGITGIELVQRFNIDLFGIDYAEQMIAEAQRAAFSTPMKGWCQFEVADALTTTSDHRFDVAYTKRCLINLDSWDKQQQAIKNILALLKPGGQYLMVESSQEGLESLNELRALVDLPAIEPPWHNRYLRDDELCELATELYREGAYLQDPVDFTSGYYMISRVINAWLAAQEGKEPSYDAIINQLALKVPSIGHYGQTRMWRWRKAG